VPRPAGWSLPLPLLLLLALALVACEPEPVAVTPVPTGGTREAPREVNLIAKDYTFIPAVLDLVPGETVLLHIVNGGLDVHEVVIGDGSVQDAWEAGEAAMVGAPPGPTPQVSVAADVGGVRVVVPSGQRVDLVVDVPPDAPTDVPPPSAGATPDPAAWTVECHIPGHLAKGMWIPVRWVGTTAS
jgi:uncharacterized cupredoxin-like copper-binding protein